MMRGLDEKRIWMHYFGNTFRDIPAERVAEIVDDGAAQIERASNAVTFVRTYDIDPDEIRADGRERVGLVAIVPRHADRDALEQLFGIAVHEILDDLYEEANDD